MVWIYEDPLHPRVAVLVTEETAYGERTHVGLIEPPGWSYQPVTTLPGAPVAWGGHWDRGELLVLCDQPSRRVVLAVDLAAKRTAEVYAEPANADWRTDGVTPSPDGRYLALTRQSRSARFYSEVWLFDRQTRAAAGRMVQTEGNALRLRRALLGPAVQFRHRR